MGEFKVADGETVVFIGDSITDCGRRSEFAPYGRGYVSKVFELVTTEHSERRISYEDWGFEKET